MLRSALNSGTYSEMLLEVEYPRTFGTITDGRGYLRTKFWIPDGLNIPAASGSDTHFRSSPARTPTKAAPPKQCQSSFDREAPHAR